MISLPRCIYDFWETKILDMIFAPRERNYGF